MSESIDYKKLYLDLMQKHNELCAVFQVLGTNILNLSIANRQGIILPTVPLEKGSITTDSDKTK